MYSSPMFKLLCVAAGAMKAAVLLVFLFFVWRVLATAPWPLAALVVLGVPAAVWLHFAWWAPRERQRAAALAALALRK